MYSSDYIEEERPIRVRALDHTTWEVARIGCPGASTSCKIDRVTPNGMIVVLPTVYPSVNEANKAVRAMWQNYINAKKNDENI